MLQHIKEVKKSFSDDLSLAKKTGEFDELYLKYFSKNKGLTTSLIKNLVHLSQTEKGEYGPLVNTLQLEQKLQIKEGRGEYEESLQKDPLIDLTLPQPPKSSGMLHPTNQITRRMNDFFRYYGFSIAEGPEIESSEYNFRKLNLPEGHPATDLQDTLFVAKDIMLRTHTSSIETRVLTKYDPPIRVAFPGKCYRNETPNASNGAFFNQYQGVVVDKGITIQNLMATLSDFHKYLFQDENIKLRFRYKYYPEVSPGLGVDVECQFCHGSGCDVCSHRGWVEVLGSGMIHYNTLKMCGIDPEVYTGYAFGMGLDRLVMGKFGINNLRKLYGGGLAFL